ncbi:enoyl-CoA hydratase/isomerase family protein [Streptosporangium amethystogenes]|uniref:enoyl-CoA hydratase/isomerase family protein n=1 Tax=Streptosporangium amethystogenes TaxID=2002 RepID=UPI0037B07C28
MKEILIDRRENGVAVLTLNLPDLRNAMTDAMTARWRQAVADLAADRDLRCVVVTGEGKAFCAGGDLSWLAERRTEDIPALRDRMLGFYRTWLTIADLEVPTIAAVNGAAVGAGLCLALACDLVYAAEEAKLLAPFTSLGLHPGMAATYLLPRVAGVGVAREMLLTGRTMTGLEAASAGLVNRAFPRESLMTEVLGIASRIAANAPVATRLTKVALAGGGHADLDAALRWESLAQPVTMASDDMLEGLAAQREQRVPRFGNA